MGLREELEIALRERDEARRELAVAKATIDRLKAQAATIVSNALAERESILQILSEVREEAEALRGKIQALAGLATTKT
jgi:F0F1-type ATP synthase membrane subunit b/b'